MTRPTCETCRNWDPEAKPSRPEWKWKGKCRGMVPQGLAEKYDPFPTMQFDDWCGGHDRGRAPDVSCGSCRFWQYVGNGNYPDTGQCRFQPPTIRASFLTGGCFWPRTGRGDRCAMFTLPDEEAQF